MPPSVVFRKIARQEMDAAIAWYEEQRQGLGLELAAEVERFIHAIADTPERFRLVRGEVRRAVLLRFPFSIHFIIESQRVVVLAVFHAKRDPKRLDGR